VKEAAKRTQLHAYSERNHPAQSRGAEVQLSPGSSDGPTPQVKQPKPAAATAPYIKHLYGLRPKSIDQKKLAKMPNFVKCSKCEKRYNAFIHACCPECGKPAPEVF